MRSAPRRRDAHIEELRARFAASRQRGDSLHQGEEARFLLHLADQPQAALTLAQANWAVQREPRDARILLEAALAAGEPEAARPALDWMAQTGIEDVALTALAQRLGWRLVRACLLALLLCLAAGAAAAHKASDAYLRLAVEPDAVTGTLDVALRDLELAIGLDGNGDGSLTWGEVQGRHAAIVAYVASASAARARRGPLRAARHRAS